MGLSLAADTTTAAANFATITSQFQAYPLLLFATTFSGLLLLFSILHTVALTCRLLSPHVFTCLLAALLLADYYVSMFVNCKHFPSCSQYIQPIGVSSQFQPYKVYDIL